MSQADGYLKFNTQIDESGFSSGIKRLGKLGKSGLSVLAAGVAGVTTAMGAGIAAGVKYNASIEQYVTSFEVMTGSAEKAAEIMEELQRIGAETPFETEDIAETTQLLMNYGFTADEAINKMQMLGDISQGSAEKMNRIATAYGQMSSAGKVSLEDVKQMIEAGFNPLQEISESTGESMTSLYDRISKGTITVDEITASMQRATAEGGKYYQSMEKQSQTINGLISTLKDNAMQLLGNVIEPISESMRTELLPAAIEAVEGISDAFEKEGVNGLIKAGSNVIASFLLGITKQAPDVIDTAFGILTSVLSALTENTDGFVSAGMQILESLILGMVEALPQLGEFMMSLFLSLSEYITANGPAMVSKGFEIILNLTNGIVSNLPMLLQAGLQMIMALVQGIINDIPTFIATVPRLINEFFSALWGFLPDLVMAGLKLIVQLGLGIIKAIPTIIANAGEIGQAILNVIGGINIFKLGKTLITKLGSGIKSLLSFIKEKAGEIAAGIFNKIKNTNWLQLGKNIITGIGNGLKSLGSWIINTAKSLFQKAWNAIKNIDWLELGKNIVKGILNGLKSMGGALIDGAKNLGKKALDSLKSFLGINSPSKVFRDEVGKMMAKGITVGFDLYPIDKDLDKTLSAAIPRINESMQPDITYQSVPGGTHSGKDEDPEDPEGKHYQYTIEVPISLDGKNLAKGTVRFTDAELATRERLMKRGVTT